MHFPSDHKLEDNAIACVIDAQELHVRLLSSEFNKKYNCICATFEYIFHLSPNGESICYIATTDLCWIYSAVNDQSGLHENLFVLRCIL